MEHYDDSDDGEEGAGMPGLFSNSKHPGGSRAPACPWLPLHIQFQPCLERVSFRVVQCA